MCSGSEAGSYLRRIDFVYHSTLGLRVIKKKKKKKKEGFQPLNKAAPPKVFFFFINLQPLKK